VNFKVGKNFQYFVANHEFW